jgi:hypothetical protein
VQDQPRHATRALKCFMVVCRNEEPEQLTSMGDAFGRRGGRAGLGAKLMLARGKPQPVIQSWRVGLEWGQQPAAEIGHNNGPPLEDPQPGYLWRRHCWTKAHAEAWKTPSMGVLKFRMQRAEAAGLSYRDYMLTLLNTGRHAQKGDTVDD